MSMPHAANQVALGEKLYLFTSPRANSPDCLIYGHGGLLHGDGAFKLMDGLSLAYFVGAGDANEIEMKDMIGPDAKCNPGRTIKGEAWIDNYTMAKGVGSGSSAPEPMTYESIAALMRKQVNNSSWCPHVVSIRRRWIKGKMIQLSEIVETVHNHNANITHFVYGACRGDKTAEYFASMMIRLGTKIAH